MLHNLETPYIRKVLETINYLAYLLLYNHAFLKVGMPYDYWDVCGRLEAVVHRKYSNFDSYKASKMFC